MMQRDQSISHDLEAIMERLSRLERKIRLLTKTKQEGEADKSFLDVDAACSFLNISRSSIYYLMRSGQLAYTRVGTQRRIFKDDLLKYLNKNYESAKPSVL